MGYNRVKATSVSALIRAEGPFGGETGRWANGEVKPGDTPEIWAAIVADLGDDFPYEATGGAVDVPVTYDWIVNDERWNDWAPVPESRIVTVRYTVDIDQEVEYHWEEWD